MLNVYRYIVILVLLSVSVLAYGEKIKTVEGSYTYYVPENLSQEEAKRIALEQAKIKAIANEFGTVVSKINISNVENIKGETTSDFYSIGGSEVKGEWIETIGTPEYNIYFQENRLVVIAKVKGKAREIKTSKINFQAKILRNGIEDKFESNDFKSGDDLYLSFVSPVSGYLAVYLVDAEEQAFCLLPYSHQSDGIYQVDANRRYLFFSIKDAEVNEQPYIDEYVMTCSKAKEFNQIYVVFSPNSFVKATDECGKTENLPRMLELKNFHKWLNRCSRQDNDLTMQIIPIKISK